MDYDCLIIGAGISGIFSAREILKKHPNWKVGLAEKYKGLGGRTHTYNKDSMRWEAGAGRVHKSHTHTMKLIKSYGLTWIPISKDTRFKANGESPIVINNFDKTSKMYLKPLTRLSRDVLANHTLESIVKAVYGEIDFFSYFPYLSEVNTLRADLALKSFLDGEMSDHSGYGVIKEGFGQLIGCMKKELIDRGCKILTEYNLLNLKKDGVCIFEGTTIKASRVILALDRDSLAKIPAFRKWDTLKYLKTQPLLRIYGVFKKPWFPSGPPIVTPGPLRYIIPINEKTIMVSYTDAQDTRAFYRIQKAGGDMALQKVIMKETRKLFSDLDISEPIFFKSHYWSTGATYWLPGSYVPEDLSFKSIRPLASLPRVWLTGESWSLRQAWVEGALEQTLLCLSDIDRHDV
jgi:glycine/D-amino acid oxidase-like deaminating enzyme